MLLYLQRKWKDNLSGCMCTAGSNQIIFPTYCDSEFDLFISVQTNTQFNFPLVLTYNGNSRLRHKLYAKQKRKEKKRKQDQVLGCCLILPLNGTSHEEPNVIHIIMTSKGVSSQCDCEDANSVNGAWNCLFLLAWHSISSSWVYVLGVAVGWGGDILPHSLHLPTSYYPILFNVPYPPRFQSCINTISPVKKGTGTYSLPPLFLIDYAEEPLLHPPFPPHVSELHWSWLDASRSSPILPTPTLWPHMVPGPPIHQPHPPLAGWQSPSVTKRKWGHGGKITFPESHL